MPDKIKENSKKIAVILFNLGGPDSQQAIKPFLMNFFMDKNIIRLPLPIRYLLAKMISARRSKKEAGEGYSKLGNKSPLLENTKAQAIALEKALENTKNNQHYKIFVCMRYWHPMSSKIVREIQDWGAEQIIILPLYPQFSTTTTRSSIQSWNKAMNHARLNIPTSIIGCYPLNKGFIEASAERIRTAYDYALKDGYKNPRLLFSAHGLPESIIKNGDPYQYQCEHTAKAIVKTLAIKNLDYEYCYQSRVGPKKWIGPSLDEALEKAAADKRAVIIYPQAFTQEHIETLVELDIEYKQKAKELGITGYYRAQTVGMHPAFIKALAVLIKIHTQISNKMPETFEQSCSDKFKHCCMKASTKG